MPPKYKKKFIKNTPIKSENLNNADYLIIVESPSKCAKIEHYLGINYCCIASKGHLRQIEGLKSIDTKKTFNPSFTLLNEKKEHVEQMKKIINKFNYKNIFLATDDDREGESIAWHICDIFDLPLNTPRILFHEITKNAIQKAIQNPTIINMDLVMAQQARQILDIIVGYKISPFLWKYLYNNKSNSLSAGRCQTPALKLIYENENERLNTKLEKYYKVIGNFTDKKIIFDLNKNLPDEKEVKDFLNASIKHKYYLTIGNTVNTNKNPPKPFHTSRLLQTASNQLHMSPKETMNICQQLYQNGFITYMRTENDSYSKDFLDKMRLYISKQFNSDEFIGNLKTLENSNSDNPHEAIRVTQIELKTLPNCENNRMVSLYKLIWRTTIESCMAAAKYKQTFLYIEAPYEYLYKTSIECPIFLGWKVVQSKIDITIEQNTYSSNIMYFKSLIESKKDVICNSIDAEVNIKNNHSYYTEASLVSKLESLGIGRPSTYSTIIETIKERGYVKKMDTDGHKVICNNYKLIENKIECHNTEKTFGIEKSKLLIQSIGILALEFLTHNFDSLFTYEYTKEMEEKLDLISNKQIDNWENICKDCYNEIKNLSKNVKNVQKKTYEIEPGYEFLFEKYGPVIKHTLDDGTIEYIPGNNDIKIEIEKLENKEYKLNELISTKPECIGEYQDKEVFIKKGPYGYYVEWGDKRESIKSLKVPLNEITIEVITEFLKSKEGNKGKDILRELNSNMCIRKGQYGPYVFYKRDDMKKPKFLNIKKFPDGFLTCDVDVLIEWLIKEYNLPE
jgi:DNA topoisomerase-1